MTMTRAGYELIAEALHQAQKQAKQRVVRELDLAGNDADATEVWAIDVAIEEITQELCTALKIENSRFERERFIDFLNGLNKKGKK